MVGDNSVPNHLLNLESELEKNEEDMNIGEGDGEKEDQEGDIIFCKHPIWDFYEGGVFDVLGSRINIPRVRN